MNHALAAFFPNTHPHVTIFDLSEHTLNAATNNMLDRKSLCLVNRQRVRGNQRQLNEYGLAWHCRKRLLPHANVHMVLARNALNTAVDRPLRRRSVL